MVSRLHDFEIELPDNQDGPEVERSAVFEEMLPVVHAALVSYYRFIEEDAQAFADTLCVWFHRAMRRNSFGPIHPQDLREQILLVACKYARAFQLIRLRERAERGDLKALLARPAEEVAIELMTQLRV